MAGPEQCDSCSEPIWWAVKWGDPEPGETPKRNPINHPPDPAGNLEVWRDGHGVLRYRYLKRGDTPVPGRTRGVSHFATCKDAARWRRPRAPGRAS